MLQSKAAAVAQYHLTFGAASHDCCGCPIEVSESLQHKIPLLVVGFLSFFLRQVIRSTNKNYVDLY